MTLFEVGVQPNINYLSNTKMAHRAKERKRHDTNDDERLANKKKKQEKKQEKKL
jgi:hypothetical protein